MHITNELIINDPSITHDVNDPTMTSDVNDPTMTLNVNIVLFLCEKCVSLIRSK